MEQQFKLELLSNNQKDLIQGLYSEIDSVIESYNMSLTTSLKEQEEKLLNYYKAELFKAKKELSSLSEK
jgi:hypothetical protein